MAPDSPHRIPFRHGTVLTGRYTTAEATKEGGTSVKIIPHLSAAFAVTFMINHDLFGIFPSWTVYVLFGRKTKANRT